MNTRPGIIGWRMIAIVAVLLLASTAPAQTFRNRDELVKQINAGVTVLRYTGTAGELYIDIRIDIRRDTSIDFAGATVKVRTFGEEPAFDVRGATFTARNYTSITHSKNWFARADNGEIVLRKFNHRGTRGIFVPRGVANLIGGVSNTREYGLYGGSIDRGDSYTAKLYIENVKFASTEPNGETPVRLMGAWGDFVRCTFDSSAQTGTRKESAQVRYGVAGKSINFADCEAKSSMSVKPLNTGEAGAETLAKYMAYSKRVPLIVNFNFGSVRGYVQVEGSTTATWHRTAFTGADPRGIGGNTAITTGWIAGTRGKAFANSCEWGMWPRKGDGGVVVKP